MKTFSIILFFVGLVMLAAYVSNDGVLNPELNSEYARWSQIMEANGIDVSKSESLRVLDYADLSSSMSGISSTFSNLIYINDAERSHPLTVRAILWHELGHYTFGLKHGECRLMEAQRRDHAYIEANSKNLESEYVQLILNKNHGK